MIWSPLWDLLGGQKKCWTIPWGSISLAEIIHCGEFTTTGIVRDYKSPLSKAVEIAPTFVAKATMMMMVVVMNLLDRGGSTHLILRLIQRSSAPVTKHAGQYKKPHRMLRRYRANKQKVHAELYADASLLEWCYLYSCLLYMCSSRANLIPVFISWSQVESAT